MVHTTRLRVKGIESSRRTRYILPRTRKAPCANLLLLPLTETLRTNNDDDDNDNVETHTGGTVHAARCLSSPPHARSLASSTSLFVSPRHHETRKQTTAVEDASCLQESSTLFHWAELVVVAGEKGDTEGERGTHIHTVARARVPTGGNERKREGEREKERETARQNDTIRLRRRSDSNWAPSGWSRPTSADSAEPRRSPIARSFPPSLPIPPIPNPSRRPSLLVLASQPPPSCLLLFPLTNSRPSFLAAPLLSSPHVWSRVPALSPLKQARRRASPLPPAASHQSFRHAGNLSEFTRYSEFVNDRVLHDNTVHKNTIDVE